MDSPYTGYYSTETSPAWAFTESPAVHDDMEFDHAISAGQVFPPIPGSSNEAVTAPKPVENKVVAMARKDSSPGKASPSSRLSISGGITKKKKKSKVLPPLVVKDPNDLKEIKKNRNTMAARQSRARKSQRFAQLKVDALTWKQRALDSGWHPRNEEEAAHLMKEIELEEDEAELV